ncbi:DMT family transporter [Planctomycetota bacterium]
MISKFKADLGLLSVTVFWGTTFILSKLTLAEVPLSTYLFLRLTLAALVLDLYALRYIKSLNKKTLLHGAILGIFLYLSYLFQMWGIQYTTASNAGFITGMSVVLVPVFGYIFFRFRPAVSVLMGISLATAGLLLLTGANPLAWNKGDMLVMICAVVVTFHVIFTGKFAPHSNVYLLTAVELSTVSILTMFALPFTGLSLPSLTTQSLLTLIYLALFGTIYTFLMQTSMQRYTTTARTALVFSMEPVFAALFAYLLAGEVLGLRACLGGALIVLGMISAEVPWITILKRSVLANKSK